MSELCKLLQPCSSLSVVLYTPCHYISSRFHFLTRLNFLIMHELSRHFIGQSSSSFRNVLSYQLFSLDEFKTKHPPPQKKTQNKTHTYSSLSHSLFYASKMALNNSSVQQHLNCHHQKLVWDHLSVVAWHVILPKACMFSKSTQVGKYMKLKGGYWVFGPKCAEKISTNH